MVNKTSVDIMTVDYIWLGEFVEKGLLTDITNYTKDWGRASDWYEANWDGGSYNDEVYGVWTVVDARGIWYWKHLLQKAGVDPNLLKTWNGYIEAAKKLNHVLKPQGIEGVCNQSATLLGGWLLSVPSTSKNKDLAWELITLVLQPKILAPFHQQYGPLPTQTPIGEGSSYSTQLNQTVPDYDQLISMLQLQGTRPNILEYPEMLLTSNK